MTEHQTTGYWDKTAGGDDVLASVAAEEIERRARAVLQSAGAVVPAAGPEAVCEALAGVLRDWFRGDGEPIDSREDICRLVNASRRRAGSGYGCGYLWCLKLASALSRTHRTSYG